MTTPRPSPGSFYFRMNLLALCLVLHFGTPAQAQEKYWPDHPDVQSKAEAAKVELQI